MKMQNGNLLCEVVDLETTKMEGGMYTNVQENSFKQLLVKEIDNTQESEVSVGDSIYVPVNAGNGIELKGKSYLIVNLRDIILIL